MHILPQIAEAFVQIRAGNPLIHHLTNYVTANDSANMTLAIGASPVMATDPGEVEEMVSHAAALVINIGTLNSQLVGSMIAAGQKAMAMGIPIILDPVGAGATALRTATARRIIREVRVSVVRGNLSEIGVLAGFNSDTRGVDSGASGGDAETIALALARELQCVVAVTGKTDIVARGVDVCRISNGHPMLARVTGTGCMASSLIGCCCAAVGDPFIGAVAGLAVMGVAGEIAQRSLQATDGLGTFRIRLFDAVSNMTPDILLGQANLDHRGGGA